MMVIQVLFLSLSSALLLIVLPTATLLLNSLEQKGIRNTSLGIPLSHDLLFADFTFCLRFWQNRKVL